MLKKKPMYQPPYKVRRQQFTRQVYALANNLSVLYGHPVDVNEIIADLGRVRISTLKPDYTVVMFAEQERVYEKVISRRLAERLKISESEFSMKVTYRGFLHVHAVATFNDGRKLKVKVVDTTIIEEGAYVLPTAKNHLLTGRHLDLVTHNLELLKGRISRLQISHHHAVI